MAVPAIILQALCNKSFFGTDDGKKRCDISVNIIWRMGAAALAYFAIMQ